MTKEVEAPYLTIDEAAALTIGWDDDCEDCDTVITFYDDATDA